MCILILHMRIQMKMLRILQYTLNENYLKIFQDLTTELKIIWRKPFQIDRCYTYKHTRIYESILIISIDITM